MTERRVAWSAKAQWESKDDVCGRFSATIVALVQPSEAESLSVEVVRGPRAAAAYGALASATTVSADMRGEASGSAERAETAASGALFG